MKLWRDYTFDEDKIEQLRSRIYEYASTHDDVCMQDVRNRIDPPENFANNDKFDINNNTGNGKKVRDWMLKRFLVVGQQNVDKAFEKLRDFYRFRYPFQVAKMTVENTLPKEFFEFQPLELIGHDKHDNQALVVRFSFYKKIPQFEMIIKRVMVYFLEKLDLDYENYKNNGICVIIDCTDFSLANVDLDLLQFIIKTIFTGYCGITHNILIYELPFLLSYVIKLVESWLPGSFTDMNGNKRKKFAVVDKETIDEYIAEDQRPSYLNGRLVLPPIEPPKNVIPFSKMAADLKMKECNILKVEKHLEYLKKEVIAKNK